MNDALAKHLLTERAKVLKELEDIDELLRSRCGWSQEKVETAFTPPNTKKEVTASNALEPEERKADPPPPPAADSNPGEEPPAISYADEARQFVEKWGAGGKFRVDDFRKYIADKYGKKWINEQSLRGPLPKMVKRGEIEIVQKGLGRNPVIYRKPFSVHAEATG